MGFIDDVGSALASAAGGAAVSAPLGMLGNYLSSEQAKKNQKEQWDMYYSPKAQVRNLAEAGINPAVAFGNNAPVMNGAGEFSIPQSPLGGIGTTSLTDLANYMNAKANAKKSGAETRNLDIDAQAKQFELDLNKYFSAPEKIAALTLAWKNVMLKNDEHNINEWKKESEKALSQLKGIERDSAQKLLDNMDIQIEQENKQRAEGIKLTQEKQKTEKSAQSSNYASAEASKATAKNQLSQAEVNKENRRIQAALADFEESAKPYKIVSYVKELKAKNAISESDYNEAILKLDRLQDVIESRNSSEIFSGVDSFSEWLKGKVSIFGAFK